MTTAGDPPEDNPDERFLEQLQSEVEAWQRERIVSPRQAGSILARYGIRHDVAERGWRLTRTTAIFATFGAILIGVGVIVLVASNRQEFDLPRAVKLGLMFGAVLFLYGVGYYLRYETSFRTVGSAVVFLGAIMYGAAVFLVGLIYNVKANDPSLPLYWFVGVVPLAYVTRSSPIVSLALITFGVWLGSQAIFSMKDSHFEQLIAVRTAVLFAMLGVLSYCLAPLHRHFKPTRDIWRPFQIAGLTTALAALFILSFRFLFEEMSDRSLPDPPTSLLITYALISALAVSAATASVRLEGPTVRTLPFEVGAALAILGLAFAAAFIPFEDEDAYALLFNVLLIGGILGAVPAGLARRQEGYINLAVGSFALLVIIRYFDLGWALHDRALFFIGAGVIILGGAFLLEYYRRQVMRRLREA